MQEDNMPISYYIWIWKTINKQIQIKQILNSEPWTYTLLLQKLCQTNYINQLLFLGLTWVAPGSKSKQ